MTFWSQRTFSLMLVAHLLQSASAIAFPSIPTPTKLVEQRLGIQIGIKPTPAPTCRTKDSIFDRRQAASKETCGWISGDPEQPVTCGSGFFCASTSTYIGCCESQACKGVFTKCYDFLGEPCGTACQNNPQNLLCPTALPYCAAYKYPGGSIGYGCAAYSSLTSSVALSTRPPPASFNPTAVSSSSTASSSPLLSSTNTATATPIVPSPSSSSSLSTGAIVGIALGSIGIVILAVIAGLLFWRRRKNKSPKEILMASSDRPYSYDPRNSYLGVSGVSSPSVTSNPLSSNVSTQGTYAFNSPQEQEAWKKAWLPHSAVPGHMEMAAQYVQLRPLTELDTTAPSSLQPPTQHHG